MLNADSESATRLEKRKRILEGALRAFARKGFFSTRISEIASEAGVADGTIYLYFKNKDDLLISLFEEKMQWLNERLVKGLASVDGPFKLKIRKLVALHAEIAILEPELAEFVTVELRQSAKFVKEYNNPKFQQYLRIIYELIVSGQEEGSVRNDVDPRLTARLLFGALDEVLLSLTLSKATKNDDVLAYVDTVCDIFSHGLLVK